MLTRLICPCPPHFQKGNLQLSMQFIASLAPPACAIPEQKPQGTNISPSIPESRKLSSARDFTCNCIVPLGDDFFARRKREGCATPTTFL
jgi:hypothetical protein